MLVSGPFSILDYFWVLDSLFVGLLEPESQGHDLMLEMPALETLYWGQFTLSFSVMPSTDKGPQSL